METPHEKNIVIVGGGIIGCCTAYYLTKHPKFDPSLHTITVLEASSIAAGASGKSGGLLGLWAYPECLVPLSYRLHKELAKEHDGDQKWGYRQVKCGTIKAVMKKRKKELDVAMSKAAKVNIEAMAPAAPPGVSSPQATESNTPAPKQSDPIAPRPPTPPPDVLPNTEPSVTTPTSQPTAPPSMSPNTHSTGTASNFTQAAFAPVPGLTPTPEPPTIPSTNTAQANSETVNLGGNKESGEAEEQNGIKKPSVSKLETDDKVWEKLLKQDTAATALLSPSHLPTDLNWIDSEYVQHWEEMGRIGFTETAQVHPFHFTTAIAELARNAGVDIRTGVKVTKFAASQVSPSINTVEYMDRNNGEEVKFIDATDIVVAAGPWTGKLLPRSKIEGLRAHSVVYEADLSPYAVFTDIQLPGDYVPDHRARAGQKRKHRGNVDPEVYARPFGEVYACGDPDKTVPLPDTADQVQPDEGQCDDLTAYLGTISSVLAAAPIKAKQACYIPQHVRFGTERGALIGPTSIANVWIAAGHTCWGVQNAPGTGLLMAEWIFDGEATSADIDVLHPAKFKV